MPVERRPRRAACVAAAAGLVGCLLAVPVPAADAADAASPTPVAGAVDPGSSVDVTVALVAPPGTEPDGTTVQQVVDAVDGPVADFWRDERAAHVRVVASHDWSSTDAGCEDPEALWDEVAARVGFTRNHRQHLLVYLGAGAAALPGCVRGTASQGLTTVDGGYAWVRELDPELIAHQLGHNLGLLHGSRLQCDRSPDIGECQVVDGGDPYDVMGDPSGRSGSLTVAHHLDLHHLEHEAVEYFYGIPERRTVTLGAVSTRTGVRAVELRSATGSHWLEYRPAAGRDAWLGTADDSAGADSGVLVRRRSQVQGHGWLLLDPTPSARAGWGADRSHALPVGVPVSLRAGQYVVTVRSVGADSATVTVEAGSPPLPRDLSGDGRADLVAVDGAGHLWLYPGDRAGGLSPRRSLGGGWQARDLVTSVGDWDGDGRHDLLARAPATGDLWLYRGNGAGGFRGWRVLGAGWNVMDALFSAGDVTGDGAVDLYARRARDGVLLLYPGNGRGGFLPTRQVGRGWQVMTELAPVDSLGGVPAFVARHRDGTLYRYVAFASGVLQRTALGAGWHVPRIVGVGDWSGDGSADLLARRRDGSLWLHTGDGQGPFRPARRVSGGWSTYRLAS